MSDADLFDQAREVNFTYEAAVADDGSPRCTPERDMNARPITSCAADLRA
ncbi:hypothetical protein [Microbacterium sp. SA39]|nr:hypothetical protein [Microbacterium sp. SA39]